MRKQTIVKICRDAKRKAQRIITPVQDRHLKRLEFLKKSKKE